METNDQEYLTLLQTIIESPNEVVIFALDKNYCYTLFNQNHKKTMKTIWGVDIEVGMNMLDLIKKPEDREKAKRNFDRALNGEKFTVIEEYGDEKLKRAFYENRYNPIINKDREIIGLTLFLTDITKVRENEIKLEKLNNELEKRIKERTEKLKISEEKYRGLVENSSDAIIIYTDGKIVFANSGAVKLARAKDVHDLIGKSIMSFVDKESKDIVKERISKLLSKKNAGLPVQIEKFKRLDGTTFYSETMAHSFYYNGTLSVQVVIRDITNLLDERHKLDQTSKIYRRAIENIQGVPYSMNYDDLTYIFLGEGIEKLIGIPANEIDFKTWRERIMDFEIIKETELSQKEYAKAFRSGELSSFGADYKIKLPNGKFKWISDNSIPIKDENGKVTGSLGILQDITKRKLSELKLQESEQKYRSITEKSNDGIVLINNEGIITEWNYAMEKLSGISKSEAIGNLIENVFYRLIPNTYNNPPLKKMIKLKIKKAFLQKDNDVNKALQEITIQRTDGAKAVIQISNFMFDTADGAMVGGIIRDISKQKEIEETLKKAKEMAEKSNKFKSEFLAQMSHEIRSPINVILSFTGLIRSEIEDELDEDLRDGFYSIERAGQRIIRTIDLLLNMSEIQTGVYDYIPKKINMFEDILSPLFSQYKIWAKEKKLNIVLTKNTDDTIITCDEYSVTQIFANLIDNAIKYTNDGKVEIKVEYDGTDRLAVSVADSGIGIAQNYLPTLFDIFSQEEHGYTRKYEGSGLGLSLVKEYCLMNNAQIKVESQKGKGSKFIVTFLKNN